MGKKQKDKIKKYQAGFTLIELLVVISIIGLISSIAMTSFFRARIKARDAQRVANVQQLAKAFNLYVSSPGASYPSTGNAPVCIGKGTTETCWPSSIGGAVSGSDTVKNALASVMSSAPKDPNPGREPGSNYSFLYTTQPILPSCEYPANPAPVTGKFILWKPENTPTFTSVDCLGVGFMTCCSDAGGSGPCGDTRGWYCAYKFDN
jgi:prepilin-type N-terminal cleavage/methylation domain-containing protein